MNRVSLLWASLLPWLAACSSAPPADVAPAPSSEPVVAPEAATVEAPAEPPADAPTSAPASDSTSAAGGATSLADLAERGLAAIRRNDAAAFNELMFTVAQVTQYCPERINEVSETEMQRLGEKVRKRVAECNERIDWSKAKEVARTVPSKQSRESECSGEVYDLGTVEIDFEVEGKMWRVRLDDPVRFGSLYVFADYPRCREREAP